MLAAALPRHIGDFPQIKATRSGAGIESRRLWARSAQRSRSTCRASVPSRRSPISPCAPALHRPLPHRLPPDPDRADRDRRRRALSHRRAAAAGLDGHDDRRGRGPHRLVEHGRGGRANRIPSVTLWELTEGPGRADQGPRLLLDRALEPGRSRPRAALGGLDSLRTALARGAAPAARAARVRRARRASAWSSPAATLTRPVFPELGFYRLSPPMSRRTRLVPPLLAALLLAAAGARRLGLRLLERLQGRGRGRGRSSSASSSTR